MLDEIMAIHDLTKTNDMIGVHQCFHGIVINDAACRFELFIGRRHRAWNSYKDFTRTFLRGAEHRTDPFEAKDICDLMRLGNKRRYAVSYRSVHERAWR